MRYPKNEIQFLDVKELPPQDRPREKLARFGSEGLSDVELLMIIIGSGTQRNPVGLSAKRLLEKLDENPMVDADEIALIPGIGTAKSKQISAALELGRRRTAHMGRSITSPVDVYAEIRHYADRDQEQFVVCSLNGAHELIQANMVTKGLINRTLIHPREVFVLPIEKRATAIILAHNHPSGKLEPSDEDIELTKRLKDCGDLLGIKVLDHLIITPSGYFSFLEHKLM